MAYAQYRFSRAVVFRLVCASFMSTTTAAQADTLQELLFKPTPLADATQAILHHASRASPETVATNPEPAMSAAERARAISAARQAIATLQQTRGAFEAGLAEQYLSLGLLHQQAAEYDTAIEHYAKAEHINRVTHGLYTPEQFLPIELSIECHLARGEFAAAMERREYLVYVHRRHYGHDAAEAVPQMLALGNMYFTAFERGIHHQPGMPELEFGPETNFVDPANLSQADVAYRWLDQARNQYFASIHNLLAHEDFANPLLFDLESKLIETLFLQAYRRSIEVDPLFFINARDPDARDTLGFDRQEERMPLYRDGEKAFTRMLAYLHANPSAAPLQVAEMMLQLGDWHMLFGRHKRGHAQYDAARAYLVDNGVDERQIAALLDPPVPVQLPVFRAAPHSLTQLARTAAPEFDGYIDVALTLDRVGSVRTIDVLGKSENAAPAVEARLRKVLRSAPFRPRLADTGSHDSLAVRYYFAKL